MPFPPHPASAPVTFAASQTVDITVPQAEIPIQHYLRQPHRLVNALADRSHIVALKDDIFRLKMRPLSLLNITFQPTVDMSVRTSAEGCVKLQSTGYEIRGVDYINRRFALQLFGRLEPMRLGDRLSLRGFADLAVRVDLPQPLSYLPESAVRPAGDGLLSGVLATIERRLKYNLIRDYCAWVAGELDGAIAPSPWAADRLPS